MQTTAYVIHVATARWDRMGIEPHSSLKPTSDSIDAHQRNWTFLTNHAAVLSYIALNPDAKIRTIGDAVGLMERATAAIIADLRGAGYITARRVGRHNEYAVNLRMPLRRPYHAASNVGDLLAALHIITHTEADDSHARPKTRRKPATL